MTRLDEELTIDDLARRAGLVVSTVRLYQNKGLLPSPTKRGRVGYYDKGHLERLQAIARLQERGFSLASIKELFDGMDSGDSLRSVLGLGHQASIWSAEEAQTMSLAELAGHLPSIEFTPAVVKRVIDLGLVEFASDGSHVIVRSPSFLKIGSELAVLGVPADEILDEFEQLQTQTDETARRFTELFRRRMWQPFVKRGMPADQIPPLLEMLEKLAPLAGDVTTMALRHSLQVAAEAFARSEARRLRIDIPRPAGAAPKGQSLVGSSFPVDRAFSGRRSPHVWLSAAIGSSSLVVPTASRSRALAPLFGTRSRSDRGQASLIRLTQLPTSPADASMCAAPSATSTS